MENFSKQIKKRSLYVCLAYDTDFKGKLKTKKQLGPRMHHVGPVQKANEQSQNGALYSRKTDGVDANVSWGMWHHQYAIAV